MWHAASMSRSGRAGGDLRSAAPGRFDSACELCRQGSKGLTAKLSPMGSSKLGDGGAMVQRREAGVLAYPASAFEGVCSFEPLPSDARRCAEEEMQNPIHEKAKELKIKSQSA